MRFRKKELRKLLGGDTHTHTNNITKHCVSICDAWLVGFFPPGTYWGEPGNVVMAKEQEEKVHSLAEKETNCSEGGRG